MKTTMRSLNMMNKKAIATTTIVLVLIVIVLAAGLIYYATLPPPTPPPPPPGPATVTGTVTDAKTGDPIAGATVEANGYRATTGPDGVYLLSVKVGTYTVTASIEGYETKTSSVSASEEKTYTADVSLPTIPLSAPDFVKTNTLIYEGPEAPQWLDPHVSYYQHDSWIIWHSLEPLIWYNGSNADVVIPWLAESFTMITPTQFEAKLRRDITFHDGTPFNATAVWFSLNRFLIMDGTDGTGNHGTQAAWLIQQFLNTSLSSALGGEQPYDSAWVQAVLAQNFVEVVDEYTVRLNLLIPTTTFPFIIGGSFPPYMVSPTSVIARDYPEAITPDGVDYTAYFEHMAGRGDTYFNVPTEGWKIGTGPYIFESYDPITYRIVLKANPDYWGGPPDAENSVGGPPKIETIEWLYQPSFATRLLDLKAGKVTGIRVSPADLYSVVDRDKWIEEGEFDPIIPVVNVHGPYPLLAQRWLNFNSNVTLPTGELREFQPFCDWRFRMAVASAVNITHINIYANSRLGIVATQLCPPGTPPEGTYNPEVIKPAYSFDLERAEELLLDAMENPLTEFTYYNGTAVPPGVVDNSFGPDKPRTIEFYYRIGHGEWERLLTTIAENLNQISVGNNMGLYFTAIPVPSGQRYTLAALHQIDAYEGGWIIDYNHVTNWLGPMLQSRGTYFGWNQWNFTDLDELYWQSVEADRAGDEAELLRIAIEMQKLANEKVLYLWAWYDIDFFVRSSWLKGYYMNTALDYEYFAPMYYEEP